MIPLTGEQASLPAGWHVVRSPGDTNAILIAGELVWAGGRDGISILDATTRQTRPLPAPIKPLRMVRAIAAGASGEIWIAHDRGVTRQTARGWQDISTQELSLTGPAMSLLPEPDGAMLIGGMGGAVRWRAGQVDPLPLPADSLDLVSTLFRDGRGVLWLGSDSPRHGGLLARAPDGRWQQFRGGRDLVHASVNDVMQIPDGMLWVATGFAGRGGISLYDGTAWRALQRDDALAGKKVRSLFRDRDGLIWAGHEYDGASISLAGEWKQLAASDGLAGEEVKVIRQDYAGAYWIGTTDGLSVLAPGSWQAVVHEPRSPSR